MGRVHLKNAGRAVADTQPPGHGLKVDIGGPVLDCLFDEHVKAFGYRRFNSKFHRSGFIYVPDRRSQFFYFSWISALER